MSRETTPFYIDGAWVAPLSPERIGVVNPATTQKIAEIGRGGTADIDRAVAAARVAFEGFAATTPASRVALLRRIADLLAARQEELADTITAEMGSPHGLARWMQTGSAILYFREAADTLERFRFTRARETSSLIYEPIGVCGLITPWNWPLNQIVTKLAPALAAGCTTVLKPSELSPLSALLLADILHEAGVPPGVFNLVNGTGPEAGAALAKHPGVDMISFTGSTRAGVLIAKEAACTVKRVHQELGGKSANIVLPDADLDLAVADGVARCFINSGQSCIAPTRMLVPRAQLPEIIERVRAEAAKIVVGDPTDPATTMGPLCGPAQFEKVQRLIARGIAEGARLVLGGLGRPPGLGQGYFVRPSVFADVTPEMDIARIEIFGPVLSVLTYETEDEAIRLANDTIYGLAAYVYSRDHDHAVAVGRRLRAGRVFLNNPPFDFGAPFGGYKQSGNGRELGEFGLLEFLEVKALLGVYK